MSQQLICPFSSQFNFFNGDAWSGTLSVRLADVANPGSQDPYTFPASATVQMNFPGQSGQPSVSILSTNALPSPFPAGNEVAAATGTTTDFNFTVTPAKSLLVAPGKNQSIDIIITNASGGVTTIEIPKCLNVFTRANP